MLGGREVLYMYCNKLPGLDEISSAKTIDVTLRLVIDLETKMVLSSPGVPTLNKATNSIEYWVLHRIVISVLSHFVIWPHS
jgi:hypothetical protein